MKKVNRKVSPGCATITSRSQPSTPNGREGQKSKLQNKPMHEKHIDRPVLSYCHIVSDNAFMWAAPSEFGTYRLCEQRRFRRACASAQSRQNLRCSLIQAVSQEEPSDRKPYPWPLWMAGHTQLKFVMTECSKTQIRLSGLMWSSWLLKIKHALNLSCTYK